MSLFVDTSVWSLAWRRDSRQDSEEVERLARALRLPPWYESVRERIERALPPLQGPQPVTAGERA